MHKHASFVEALVRVTREMDAQDQQWARVKADLQSLDRETVLAVSQSALVEFAEACGEKQLSKPNITYIGLRA